VILKACQAHLEGLAESLGCRLDQPERDTPGMMYVEFGYVEGPQLVEVGLKNGWGGGNYPDSCSRYLTNLHELGHFAHGHTQGRPPKQDETFYFDNGVLQSEAEAWAYALDNTCTEITPEARWFMWNTCLNSYHTNAWTMGYDTPGQRLWNGDRGYVRFAYGQPTAFFWSVVERILNDADRFAKVLTRYDVAVAA
jgi:hypothetical protein